MTWSTRELADLAGTTVNTVRHYHALGLLDEPQRRYNGYKRYQVRHLVCLLRVRRLAELGVPLSQVAAVCGDGADPTDALRGLDAELRADIERLRRARSDIAAILRDSAPVDTPQGFEPIASRLSEADRSLLHICTRLYDQDAISELLIMVAAEPGAVSEEFNALAPDADDATRQRIAEQIASEQVNWRSADRPWLSDPARHLCNSEHVTRQTLTEALIELYNPAQREVLHRAGVAADEPLRAHTR
ncbi:MerR family transcriptional regulator [Streptosporangium lutulentum]|uniref:DNA-binding transcriptional MerR regulator n=1 Tax=Streptosporangium lutulentum TaxID=1461250 RepID=A0ABT9QBS6_9ACTN|nr:MerR family transcriptional regulator [Streptosporangium lutulentum]MDP9843499.1 DNA-binding transcriptional MerR regulator [Streptosporangium lutulentum]